MQFGNYECFSIDMGGFWLDGGAMFGVVPKTLWDNKIPADEKNRIPMKARSLLIKGNGKNIIIDTGCGTKLDKKMKTIYQISDDPQNMDVPLEKYGITSKDITHVILSHLHFDHAGGSTCRDNGEVVPCFPNAVYYIQKNQWETACAPSFRDRSSYIHDNFIPLEEKEVLHLLSGSQKLFDGIDIFVSDGHTMGQQHVLVKGDDNSLFFCGDLIPTSAHIPLPWHMAYDNLPLVLMEEKEKILKRALNEKWILFFEHDPVVCAATIKESKKGIEIDKVIEI